MFNLFEPVPTFIISLQMGNTSSVFVRTVYIKFMSNYIYIYNFDSFKKLKNLKKLCTSVSGVCMNR